MMRAICVGNFPPPSVASLAAAMPDLADDLAGAMSELARDPETDRCDEVLMRLNAAQVWVRRLRTAIERDLGTPPEAA